MLLAILANRKDAILASCDDLQSLFHNMSHNMSHRSPLDVTYCQNIKASACVISENQIQSVWKTTYRAGACAAEAGASRLIMCLVPITRLVGHIPIVCNLRGRFLRLSWYDVDHVVGCSRSSSSGGSSSRASSSSSSSNSFVDVTSVEG
jgi:uncharacterized membrane protein YgcG